MKAVVLNKLGGTKVLQVSNVPKPTIGPTQVLLKVKYACINYADLLSRQGLYSWAPKRPYVMGLEAVGEVVEVGEQVTGIKVGDRYGYGGQKNGYAEYIAAEQEEFLPIPSQFTDEEAGAFLVTWMTAWVALFEMARVRKGERLLVHAGAGGVGTAAIILAKTFGMEVYGTSSTESKRNIIEELGATALSYEDFSTKLKNMPPDCILESIGGDVFRKSLRLAAPMGRVVTIGASGIQVNKYNPLSWWKAYRALPRATQDQLIRRSHGFMGLHIGYMLRQRERLLPVYQQMLEFIDKHQLRPVVRMEQIYPMSRVADAHQLIHDRKNIGKVLLDPSR